MRRLPAVAVLALLVGCESPVQPPSALEGDWRGSFGYTRVTVQLSQADGRLAGTGTLGPTEESGLKFPSYQGLVTGSYRPPLVDLDWGNGVSARFTGRLVAPDRIEGTMTWTLGPAPGALTLRPQ